MQLKEKTMIRKIFKKMMTGAVLAAVLGSSALAQSYDPEAGSGNIVPNTNFAPTGPTVNEPYFEPFGARAFAPESRGYSTDPYAYQAAPRHHLRYHTMQGHSDMDRF
jgi:hypothetical protein